MKITVYCGAASGSKPDYGQSAKKLGVWIADSGFELVYGGGGVGLMGVIASAALSRGGKVHGIMPGILFERGAACPGLSDLEIVDDMDQRKRRMMELGDVYVAFPGGPGTLEEITQAFSWSRLGLTSKPSVFFDYAGYWSPVAAMYDRMVIDGFLTAQDRSKLLFTDSVDAIDAWVGSYVPPATRIYNDATASQMADQTVLAHQ
jgi:uncharacterized protein (TIGR00730 family)